MPTNMMTTSSVLADSPDLVFKIFIGCADRPGPLEHFPYSLAIQPGAVRRTIERKQASRRRRLQHDLIGRRAVYLERASNIPGDDVRRIAVFVVQIRVIGHGTETARAKEKESNGACQHDGADDHADQQFDDGKTPLNPLNFCRLEYHIEKCMCSWCDCAIPRRTSRRRSP